MKISPAPLSYSARRARSVSAVYVSRGFCRARNPCWIAVGRRAGPDELHAIEIEGMSCLSRHQKADAMNRIEGPPRTPRRLGPLAVTTVRVATRPVKTMA